MTAKKSPRVLQIFGSFCLGTLIGVFILLLILTGAILGFEREYQDRVYPGVYLSEVSLSGKTRVELEAYLGQIETQIEQKRVVLSWRQEQKNWELKAETIDFSLDRQETTKKVFSLGRKESGLASLTELYQQVLFPQNVMPAFLYSGEKLDAAMATISAQVEKPGREALFEFKAGKVVSFQTSQEGRQLETEQLKRLVVLAFSQIAPTQEAITLPLPVKEVKPKVATEESNNLGIKEVLGEGESFFFDSISSRIYNIGLASSRLHGVVISPGETFSFAQTVGEVTAQTGYQQAYVIKEKKTILEDGGGVCQVSTTLFRAALNSGLPIVERVPHYYRVSFYEQGGYPPGLDATVYPPSPDFKFKNDTPAYLLIQANFDKAKKRLAFTLYGTNDGRKTEVLKPVIHSRTEPPEPTYFDDPTLPSGVVKQTDQAHPGAKVSFKRKVWWANGELKEEREFWSDYVAWPAVYLRGTGPSH